MVVNLLKGVEKVSVLRQGWSILQDPNSAASLHALVFIPDSTDLRPGLLSLLHIHHLTIRNELTVRYAQIYTHLKIPTHPTQPDFYSLVIKFYILGLSKFRFFYVRFYWKRLRAYTTEGLCINYACITCLLYCASDVNVNFKDVLHHMTADLLP